MLSRAVPRLCVATRAHAAIASASEAHTGSFGMELLKTARSACPVQRGESLVFPFTVTLEVTNGFEQLHGGAYAALADVFTTAHLWGLRPESAHVSMDFNVQYYKGIPVGTDVHCVTRVTKLGNKVAFTHFSFVDATSGAIHCEGSHTKAMVPKR
jgi:uncharacterized protein (TIGR00369 family)